MIASGRRLIVVTDSTKWGVVGLSSMAKLCEASILVTDVGLRDAARRILSEKVDEVILVDPDRPATETPTSREA